MKNFNKIHGTDKNAEENKDFDKKLNGDKIEYENSDHYNQMMEVGVMTILEDGVISSCSVECRPLAC